MIYEKYYMSSPGHLKWKDIYALREPSSFHTKCFCLGQNKILLFPKNFHPGSRKFIFLNQISDDILFFSSVFYAFFDSCLLFVCLFVRCFFLKLKMYILIHIWLFGQVSDNFFLPGQFLKTTFLLCKLATNFNLVPLLCGRHKCMTPCLPT